MQFVNTPEVGVPSNGVTKLGEEPRDFKDEAVTLEASVVPVTVPAGAITAFPAASVINPLALTVKFGIDVDDPNDPTFVLTVARVALIAVAPEPLTSPLKVID